MNGFLVLGIPLYFIIGLIATYLILRDHAKRNKVSKEDVLGCGIMNILLWPAIVPYIVWDNISINFKPLQKIADHFNKVGK